MASTRVQRKAPERQLEPPAELPPCPACDGRGVVWAAFKFYKTCPACQGSKRAANV